MTGVLRPATEVAITSAFVFGMMLALLGSLKLTLSRSLDLSEGRAGVLLFLQNLALVPMMLLCGVLIDAGGVRGVILASSAVTALSLLALGSHPGTSRAFVGLLFCGLGSAGLGTGSVVLMPQAFFPGEPLASLNLGVLFFALGALVTPVLTDVLLRAIGYRKAIAVLAAASFVPAVLAALPGAEELRSGGVSIAEEFSGLVSHNSLWLAAVVVAMYTPLEASISFWATTYLTDRGLNERRAAWFLSGFWGAFLLSRLLVAALLHGGYLHQGWDSWILVIPSLLAAVTIGNMAGAVAPEKAGNGLLFLGFCLGPIFPTLVGMVFERMEEDKLQGFGTAFGMLFAAGSLGCLVLAPVVASTADKKSVQSALRVPMFEALLLTAVVLVFGLAR
jgi:fucose permease